MPRDRRPDSSPIPVLVNTTSGGGHSQAILDELGEHFREAGVPVELIAVGAGENLEERARELMKRNPPVIVAAGGDGTVSTVAEVVRGTDTALGVIPLGTLNHFTRDMGIPTDVREAVEVIARGHRVAIDVGEVNGVSFVNNSSLGLYPGMVRRRESLQRRLRRSKRAAMVWAILAVMRRAPLLHMRVRADDREGELRSPFVFIGNNNYVMEGFDIGKRERLDAGRLSVYTTVRTTVAGLVGLAFRALFGRLRQARDFAMLEAYEMRIDSPHRRLLVATDGEVRAMDTPLRYILIPGALKVVVPPPAA